MALSHLETYTEAQWNNLGIEPLRGYATTQEGNPDPNVTIHPHGWVGTHLFAFKTTTNANNDSGLNIDAHEVETMDVTLTEGSAPSAFVSYYTVETSPGNGKDDDWTVGFEVYKEERDNKKKKTGKWVFTKSNDDDDTLKKRRGCMGLFASFLP